MSEVWKPVVGHEADYEVSNLGRVRSIDRVKVYKRIDQYSGNEITVTRRHKGRVLRPGTCTAGHQSVAIGKNNSRLVHQLVLEAFVGPCPAGEEGRHFNDVPADNKLSNLSWGTRSQNLLDAVRNGKKPVGEKHHLAKLKDADIILIREASGPRGINTRLSEKFGVSEAVVRSIRSRKTWRHVP